MSKCEKCVFYDKEYDDSLMSDVINDKEPTHYCIMHRYGITNAVWSGKEKCKDYTDKNI